MRLNFLISCLVAFCGIQVFAQQKEANYQVIPLPQQIDMQQGKPFILNAQTKIAFPAGNEILRNDAKFLADYIKETTGRTISVSPTSSKMMNGKNVIVLKLDKEVSHNEGYFLSVDKRLI